eukprot:159097-Prorocentrum_minimum.AAC.1
MCVYYSSRSTFDTYVLGRRRAHQRSEAARVCARKSFRLLARSWGLRARKLASELPPAVQDSTLTPIIRCASQKHLLDSALKPGDDELAHAFGGHSSGGGHSAPAPPSVTSGGQGGALGKAQSLPDAEQRAAQRPATVPAH